MAKPKPRRIQLKRTKGWRKPAGAVVVTRATRWGNPYRVADWGQQRAVSMFRIDLRRQGWIEGPKGRVTVEEIRAELRGKDLACFCDGCDPCHADVLIKIANSRGPLAPPRRSVSGGFGIGEKPDRIAAAAAERRSAAMLDDQGEPLPVCWDFVLDRGVG
ncbi:DUF4326 domain-containing protein [Maricaulis maris]|uniref:Uncharacterized protein DUF4326 n=1 Tax=Maricaulis maris TaxID=74318 RepID=A0A495D1K9_9PROT|nr:DUF4326 domain-containing protein [Maricaulis maris]RKQ95442.1 uncharacterized protein DUF4326 [Maricaulis maris]